MGKKRRILTRTTKFAKKYFGFLDKVDGSSNKIDAAEIDNVIEVGDDFVDTLVITDLGNQTVKIAGRVIGFEQNDKVQISLDGGTFGTDTTIDHDAAGARSGLDKMQYLISAFDNGSFLSAGEHTFSVRKKDEDNEALHSDQVGLRVKPAKVDLSAITAEESVNVGKIRVQAASSVDVALVVAGNDASGSPAGELSFILGSTDATTNDLSITVKDSNQDIVQQNTGVDAIITTISSVDLVATGIELESNEGDQKFLPGDYTVEITPRFKNNGSLITADTITLSVNIPVEAP